MRNALVFSFAFIWLYVPDFVYAADTIEDPLNTEATRQKLDALEQNYEEQQREIKMLKQELKEQRSNLFSSAIAKFNPQITLNGLFTAADFQTMNR